jgi:hypothetical protein
VLRAQLLHLTVVALVASACDKAPATPEAETKAQAAPTSAASALCEKTALTTIGGTAIVLLRKDVLSFTAGLSIDADGAPHAYHESDDKGLDYLANAGKQGNYWALVTDTGKPDGAPVKQTSTDPAPGYFISMTSLEDKSRLARDPARFVDSERVVYIALPKKAASWGAHLGDVALVTANGKRAAAVFADVGGDSHVGEGSIALADALGIPSSPKKGGAKDGVTYRVFMGSGKGWPRAKADIDKQVTELVASLGCVPPAN